MAFFILACLLVALIAVPIQTAWAQGASILRTQNRIINRAVQEQVRQALRPTFAIRRDAAGPVVALSAVGDRYLVMAMGDNRTRIWDLASGRQRWVGSATATALVQALVDPGLNVLVELLADGVLRLTDLAVEGEPSRRFAHPQGLALTAIALMPDGQTVLVGDAKGGVLSVSVADARVRAQIAGAGAAVTAFAIHPNGGLALAGQADGGLLPIKLGSGLALTALPRQRMGTAAVRALAGASSGFAVLDADGALSIRQPTEALAETGKMNGMGADAAMAVTGEALYVAGGGKLRRISLPHGRMVAEQPVELAAPRVAAVAGGVFVGKNNSMTQLFGLDAIERATLVATRSSWVVLDIQGRFDGDERAFRDAVWATSDGDVMVDAFSNRYYDPGVLVRALDPNRAAGQPTQQPIGQGIFLPPVVQITDVQAPAGAGAQVNFALTVEDGLETGFSELRLFSNGKFITSLPAASFSQQALGQQRWRWTRQASVATNAGANQLEAVAIGWNGISSQPVVANWQVAAPPAPRQLIISSFGVNNYMNQRWNLNFAVADANAVAEVFNGQGKRGYRTVSARVLVDNAATRPAVTEHLRQLENASADDVLVLFLAGHGKAIDGEWYFLPQHVLGDLNDDAAIKRNGLSAGQLAEYLTRSPVQQIVLLIDACNSGAAIGAFDDFDARRQLRQLSRQTGVHILTATRADELAPEYTVLGHGVFTRVLIAAFEANRQGGMNGDTNGDGEITVQELGGFLATTVPRLINQLDRMLQNSAGVQRGEYSKRTLVSPANHGIGTDFTLVRSR